jgi:hypothetical protein
MARSIIAGDFSKEWQYEQAKRQERKNTRNIRVQRQSKQSKWTEKE